MKIIGKPDSQPYSHNSFFKSLVFSYHSFNTYLFNLFWNIKEQFHTGREQDLRYLDYSRQTHTKKPPYNSIFDLEE